MSTSTLLVVFSSWALGTIFHFSSSVWLVFFSVFLTFVRFGSNKTSQILNLLKSFVVMLLILIIAIFFCHTLEPPFDYISVTILTFLAFCLPRFMSYGKPLSIFTLVLLLIYLNYFGFQPKEYLSDLALIIKSAVIVSFSYCFVIYVIPLTQIPTIPINKDIYVFKQAFRISLNFLFAIFASLFLPNSNILWICIIALVLSQQNLAMTIEQAKQRVFGTVIGLILGYFIAIIYFEPFEFAKYSLVFLLFAIINFALARKVFIVTVLASIVIINLYFFMPVKMTFNDFVELRLIDTLIGVIIAIIGELIFFPRSISNDIRLEIMKFYHDMTIFLQKAVNESLDTEQMLAFTKDFRIKTIQLHQDYTFLTKEPLFYFTTTAKLYEIVDTTLNKMVKSLSKISAEDLKNNQQFTSVCIDIFSHLHSTIPNLKDNLHEKKDQLKIMQTQIESINVEDNSPLNDFKMLILVLINGRIKLYNLLLKREWLKSYKQKKENS